MRDAEAFRLELKVRELERRVAALEAAVTNLLDSHLLIGNASSALGVGAGQGPESDSPPIAAPRALQGECKAWCGQSIQRVPTNTKCWPIGETAFCTKACRAAHPPATPERPGTP